MAYGGEAIDGAEVAGDVDWDEEEVGVERVKGSHVAGQQRPVDCNLGREQVAAAPLVREPICVVLRRKIVHEHPKVPQGPCNAI